MIGILKSKDFIAFSVLISLVLICLLVFPIYRVEDDSMYPTLRKGDVVVGFHSRATQGDIVVVRYNKLLLVRRLISTGGHLFDMNDGGKVYIDKIELKEPYLDSLSRGILDITLPYEVPEDRLFIMGDNRKESIDSRSTALGTVSRDMIDSVLYFCIWPINDFGLLENR